MSPKTGTVVAMGVVKDRVTGSPKGFAFIETQADFTKPFTSFNGKWLDGKIENTAKPRCKKQVGYLSDPKHHNRSGSTNRE
jgi:hypothetical protein